MKPSKPKRRGGAGEGKCPDNQSDNTGGDEKTGYALINPSPEFNDLLLDIISLFDTRHDFKEGGRNKCLPLNRVLEILQDRNIQLRSKLNQDASIPSSLKGILYDLLNIHCSITEQNREITKASCQTVLTPDKMVENLVREKIFGESTEETAITYNGKTGEFSTKDINKKTISIPKKELATICGMKIGKKAPVGANVFLDKLHQQLSSLLKTDATNIKYCVDVSSIGEWVFHFHGDKEPQPRPPTHIRTAVDAYDDFKPLASATPAEPSIDVRTSMDEMILCNHHLALDAFRFEGNTVKWKEPAKQEWKEIHLQEASKLNIGVSTFASLIQEEKVLKYLQTVRETSSSIDEAIKKEQKTLDRLANDVLHLKPNDYKQNPYTFARIIFDFKRLMDMGKLAYCLEKKKERARKGNKEGEYVILITHDHILYLLARITQCPVILTGIDSKTRDRTMRIDIPTKFDYNSLRLETLSHIKNLKALKTDVPADVFQTYDARVRSISIHPIYQKIKASLYNMVDSINQLRYVEQAVLQTSKFQLITSCEVLLHLLETFEIVAKTGLGALRYMVGSYRTFLQGLLQIEQKLLSYQPTDKNFDISVYTAYQEFNRLKKENKVFTNYTQNQFDVDSNKTMWFIDNFEYMVNTLVANITESLLTQEPSINIETEVDIQSGMKKLILGEIVKIITSATEFFIEKPEDGGYLYHKYNMVYQMFNELHAPAKNKQYNLGLIIKRGSVIDIKRRDPVNIEITENYGTFQRDYTELSNLHILTGVDIDYQGFSSSSRTMEGGMKRRAESAPPERRKEETKEDIEKGIREAFDNESIEMLYNLLVSTINLQGEASVMIRVFCREVIEVVKLLLIESADKSKISLETIETLKTEFTNKIENDTIRFKLTKVIEMLKTRIDNAIQKQEKATPKKATNPLYRGVLSKRGKTLLESPAKRSRSGDEGEASQSPERSASPPSRPASAPQIGTDENPVSPPRPASAPLIPPVQKIVHGTPQMFTPVKGMLPPSQLPEFSQVFSELEPAVGVLPTTSSQPLPSQSPPIMGSQTGTPLRNPERSPVIQQQSQGTQMNPPAMDEQTAFMYRVLYAFLESIQNKQRLKRAFDNFSLTVDRNCQGYDRRENNLERRYPPPDSGLLMPAYNVPSTNVDTAIHPNYETYSDFLQCSQSPVDICRIAEQQQRGTQQGGKRTKKSTSKNRFLFITKFWKSLKL